MAFLEQPIGRLRRSPSKEGFIGIGSDLRSRLKELKQNTFNTAHDYFARVRSVNEERGRETGLGITSSARIVQEVEGDRRMLASTLLEQYRQYLSAEQIAKLTSVAQGEAVQVVGAIVEDDIARHEPNILRAVESILNLISIDVSPENAEKLFKVKTVRVGKEESFVSRQGIYLTDEGKSTAFTLLSQIIADNAEVMPELFARDYVDEVVNLAREKLESHRSELLNSAIHNQAMVNLLRDNEFRRFLKGEKPHIMAKVDTIFRLGKIGDDEMLSSFDSETRGVYDNYFRIYQKKVRGVRRANIRAGRIKKIHHDTFNQVIEFDQVYTRAKTLLSEVLRQNEALKSEGRIAELSQQIFIETGINDKFQLYNLARSRLADEKRIAQVLDLDNSSLTIADKTRIVENAYSTWAVIRDDIVHNTMEAWDGTGKCPIEFTKAGNISAKTTKAMFEQIKAELLAELEKLGMDIEDFRFEKRSAKLSESVAKARIKRIRANIDMIKGRSNIMTNSLLADIARVERSYPLSIRERIKKSIALDEKTARYVREKQVDLQRFMDSNVPYKVACTMRLVTVLGGIAAGTGVVNKVIREHPDLLPRLADNLTDGIHDFRTATERYVQTHTIEEMAQDFTQGMARLGEMTDYGVPEAYIVPMDEVSSGVSTAELSSRFTESDHEVERLQNLGRLEQIAGARTQNIESKELPNQAIVETPVLPDEDHREVWQPDSNILDETAVSEVDISDNTIVEFGSGSERGELLSGKEIKREVHLVDKQMGVKIQPFGRNIEIYSQPYGEKSGYGFSPDSQFPVSQIEEFHRVISVRSQDGNIVNHEVIEPWGAIPHPDKPGEKLYVPLFSTYIDNHGKVITLQMSQPVKDIFNTIDPGTGMYIGSEGITAGDWYEGKEHNVNNEMVRLDGKVLKPGEQTTLVDVIGNITKVNGFVEGGIFQGAVGTGRATGGGGCAGLTAFARAVGLWIPHLSENEIDTFVGQLNAKSRLHSQPSYFAGPAANAAMLEGSNGGQTIDAALWDPGPGSEGGLDFIAINPTGQDVVIKAEFIFAYESPFNDYESMARVRVESKEPFDDSLRTYIVGPYRVGGDVYRPKLKSWILREDGLGIESLIDWSDPDRPSGGYKVVRRPDLIQVLTQPETSTSEAVNTETSAGFN